MIAVNEIEAVMEEHKSLPAYITLDEMKSWHRLCMMILGIATKTSFVFDSS